MYDIAIIGGGVLGNMVAWQLSRYQLDIVVLEKEYDIGEATTKANSGIIHAGFHARGGSLKGISGVAGNALYGDLCRQLDIPFRRIGSLFLSFHEAGRDHLQKIWERGQLNGVPDLRWVDRTEILEMEPLINPKVRQAIFAPTTGILSPFDLVVGLAEAAAGNAVEYRFAAPVTAVEPQNRGYRLETPSGQLTARCIVNAAGGLAGTIESQVRPTELDIRPKRGQYYLLNRQAGALVNHVLYQAAETDEGGALIAPTIEGHLLIGPTSEPVRNFNRVETTPAGLAKLERIARKVLPDLDQTQILANFAGLRANIVNVAKEEKDFVVRRSAERFVSALGIKNPGMTAAPDLARRLIALLVEDGLLLKEKPGYIAERRRFPKYLEQPATIQAQLIAQNPAEGKIICRCERITEGDILRALRRPLPPAGLDGLKKRLRLGMGTCQGSFCTMRALEIMARELGLPPEQILKNSKGSALIKGRVK